MLSRGRTIYPLVTCDFLHVDHFPLRHHMIKCVLVITQAENRNFIRLFVLKARLAIRKGVQARLIGFNGSLCFVCLTLLKLASNWLIFLVRLHRRFSISAAVVAKSIKSVAFLSYWRRYLTWAVPEFLHSCPYRISLPICVLFRDADFN